MARTTLDIDSEVLAKVKEVAKRKRRPVGDVVSELVEKALALEPSGEKDAATPPFSWPHQPMGCRFDTWEEIKDFLDAEDVAAFRASYADNA